MNYTGVLLRSQHARAACLALSAIHGGGMTMATRKKFRIPGLTFSWKRALGITQLKQRIARKTGIPTTRQGRQRKLERTLFKFIFRK